MIQKLQLYILKYGVKHLKDINNKFAASCLEHALQKNPKDIEITSGFVIDEIKNEPIFKQTIKKFISKNQGKKSFYESENIKFNNGDLFNALHEVTLTVQGNRANNKWNLDITIIDSYDFTDLIKLQDYIKENQDISQSLKAVFGNNLALIATSCNVVHKYNITIKFNMKI